jgi:hypothetical protein
MSDARNIGRKLLKGLSALWRVLNPMNSIMRLADGPLTPEVLGLGAPQVSSCLRQIFRNRSFLLQSQIEKAFC